MLNRTIDRVASIPALGPGFGGDRHRAALVVPPGELAATDPFFLMADDHIVQAGPFGEAHPHAGLETVTFMLEGTLEENGVQLAEGDVEWMTAGSGIVHGENVSVPSKLRLFQLWLILPEAQRNMRPRVQILRRTAMPVHSAPGVTATVYSGQSGDAVARTLNAVPVTLLDIRLEPGAVFAPELPASYNGFLVVLHGRLEADATSLAEGTVGWTSPVGEGASSLSLRAGEAGARVLLYAGEPQRTRVAAQGPFIAGSRGELSSYYAAYRQGSFPRASAMRPITSA